MAAAAVVITVLEHISKPSVGTIRHTKSFGFRTSTRVLKGALLHSLLPLVMLLGAGLLSGCSGRESSAAKGIQKAGGEAVTGAKGVVDYVEFAGSETTDETLDKVVRELTALASLKRIQLRDTAVAGPGLKAFAGLKQVRVVDVQGSPVNDEGLATIGTLAEVTSLNLARTKITDAGLASLASLKKLRILDLSGTSVSDAGLAKLSSLGELRSLNVNGTKVTALGIANLKRSHPELSIAK